jgi:hypothetical protein
MVILKPDDRRPSLPKGVVSGLKRNDTDGGRDIGGRMEKQRQEANPSLCCSAAPL